MADDVTNLETLMKELIRTVRDQGSVSGGGENLRRNYEDLSKVTKDELKQKVEQVRVNKAMQQLEQERTSLLKGFNKDFAQFSDDLSAHSQLLTGSIEDAISKMDLRQFDKFQEALAKGDANINLLAEEGIANIFELMSGYQAAVKEVEATGKSLDELRAEVDAGNTEFQFLVERTENLGNAMENARKQADNATDSYVNRMSEWYGKLAPAVAAVTAAFQQAVVPALRMGTEVRQSLTSFMAGMNPEEMAQNLAEYRRTINASGMSMGEFRDATEKGSFGLTAYTGDLRDAVRVQSSALEAAQRFGASNQTAFMNQQVGMFKKFNEVFSMTAEEFIEMNKQIRSSQSINEQIYRLNNKQRSQYALEIQQTVLRLKTFGLMQDQAMKVVDAMAAIGAKSPKERLKEAAKLQAVGGALGFGQAANEMADIMRRGMRGEGDMERYAELQKEAQGVIGQRMGSGFASELMTAQLLQTTQMEELLGPKSAFADLNTEQNMATQNIEQYSKKNVEILGYMQASLNMIQNAITGPIAVAVAGIWASTKLGAFGGALGGGKLMGMIMPLIAGALPAIVGLILGGGLIYGMMKVIDQKNYASSAQGQQDYENRKATEDFQAKQYKELKKLIEEQKKKTGIKTLGGRDVDDAVWYLPGNQAGREYKMRGEDGSISYDEIGNKTLRSMGSGEKATLRSQDALLRAQSELKAHNERVATNAEKMSKEELKEAREMKKALEEAVTVFKEIGEKIANPDKAAADAVAELDKNEERRHQEATGKADQMKVLWARNPAVAS